MRHDPLTVLARVRALQTRAAQRALAGRLGQQVLAEARAAAAAAALPGERGAAEPTDYAAWLPRAFAQRERATRGAVLAGQATDAARTSLAEARAAERALERLRAVRRLEVLRRAHRREGARLDEVAARRNAGPG